MAIYLFKNGEDSPASKMSLGDVLKSLEEGVEFNNNIVNTPISDMALQCENGPLLEIRFLEGG